MNQRIWPTSFDPATGIAYAELGRGPIFLFLHGLFDTSYTWHRLFQTLSADAHLIGPDLPGFGRSPLPANWGESVTELVDRLLRFSDRWKGEKAVLVGSSMGGGLALAMAASAPDRFDRIVLMNPFAGSAVPVAVAGAKHPLIGSLIPLLLFWPFRKALIRAIFSRSLYDQAHLTAQYVEELNLGVGSFARRRDLVRFLRRIDLEIIRRFETGLSGIRQEVLLIWGEEDRWLPSDGADRLQTRLLRCQRVNVSHCGHLPHLERAEEVGRAIRGFMRGRISVESVL